MTEAPDGAAPPRPGGDPIMPGVHAPTGRGKAPVPCPWCATPFSDRPALQQHLVDAHGQKQKQPKKVKLVDKPSYMPRSYNPAKGFLPSVALGILAAVLVALLAPEAFGRYALPVGALVIGAAKYGVFNR